MNIFRLDKIMNRLDRMLDNAIDGKPIEEEYDETKLSALETKLSKYLAMGQVGKQQLSEDKQRMNSLISDISHQTKTPIANILLYAQLLEESNLSEKDRLCIDSLVAQTQKLNFLVASLMKGSRLETGILTLHPKKHQVHPMLTDILFQLQEHAQSKNITLTYKPTEDGAVFDMKWTTEAIFNILDNAIKYTPMGGSIIISVLSYQLFCRIDIRDNGIGISEEEIPKIFLRFYRSPLVSDEEGVGIGLYLAREIIREDGGYIKVSSEYGKGSTFSVFLPIRDEIFQNR